VEKKTQVNMYLAMTLECNMSWFTGFSEEALRMRSWLTCPGGSGAGGGGAKYIYFEYSGFDEKLMSCLYIL
jgi:hypothetical protein